MTWRRAELGAFLLGSAVALRDANCLPMCFLKCVCSKVFAKHYAQNRLLKSVCSKVFAKHYAPNRLLTSVCSKVFALGERLFAQKCLLKSVCSKVFAQKCLLKSVCQTVCSELFAQNRLLQDGSLGKSVCQTVCMPVQTISLAEKCLPYSITRSNSMAYSMLFFLGV